jgi:ribose/xylose/arabinose/galactoside ABC-type transport system permease subunit
MSWAGLPEPGATPSATDAASQPPAGYGLAAFWSRLRGVPALGLVVLLIAMWLIATIAVPRFGSFENIRNVLRQSSDLSIAATGILFVLIVGGIDLSVGAVYGLTSVVLVTVMTATGSAPIALAAAVVVGLAIGSLNGILVEWVKVPAFITTLGMYYIAFALAQMISAGSALRMPANSAFATLQTGEVFGVPLLVIVAVSVAVSAWVLLNRTSFGRAAVAAGYNRVTSGLSGVRVSRVIVECFAISSVLGALGAVLLTSRVQTGEPTLGGFNTTFETITAAVVGGTSLFGGRGTVLGVIAGALIIRTIGNCITLLNITPLLYQAVMGSLIVLALVIEALRARYAGERA